MAAVRQQSLLGDHQIRQSEQGARLRAVLCQPLVEDLATAEAVLVQVKRMLYKRAHPDLEPFYPDGQLLEHALRR